MGFFKGIEIIHIPEKSLKFVVFKNLFGILNFDVNR